MQPTPTTNLSPNLNVTQMMQNIDAMQKQKVDKNTIQSYVNNYAKSSDGSYILKGSTQPKPSSPSLGEFTANAQIEGGNKVMSSIQKGASDIQKGGVGNTLKGVGESALGSASGFLQELMAPVTGAVNYTADKISNSPLVQKIAQSGFGDAIAKGEQGLSDWAQKNPELSTNLSDGLNVLLAVIGEKAVPGDVTNPVKEDLNTAKTNIVDTAGKVSDMTGKIKDTISPPVDLEKNAIQDATPAYDPKLIGKEKISEAKGMNPTNKRIVQPKDINIEAGKELSKVEGYNPKGTALEKYNTVTDDIIQKSKNYRQSLASEKVVIPKKEILSTIRKVVNETSQNSLLLQKTDPIVKNYIRVATRAAETVDGTLAGEDALRLKLDQAYEDAGGKYGNNKGLDQIHRAARNAITADMIAKAQTTEVKASLKQMENLYNAADVLKDKAQAEGGSKWEQFKKAHPVITKGAKAVGRAVGIGEAVHLAP